MGRRSGRFVARQRQLTALDQQFVANEHSFGRHMILAKALLHSTLLTGLLAGLLGACIVLPIPIAPSGSGAAEVQQLEIGTSTRKEVHDLLGDPNLMATPRHELWEVERDPFHLNVLIGMAGPGGGGGGFLPVYPGEEAATRYRIAIAYDDQGRVSGWRSESVQLDSNQEIQPWSRTMYAESEPASDAAVAGRSRIWSASAYALSPDGNRAALLRTDAEGRPQLELFDLVRVLSLADARDWPEVCSHEAIRSIMLGFDQEDILSLPITSGLLCRWKLTDGRLAAVVTAAPALRDALEGRSIARLLGRSVVVRTGGTRISVWDAAGRELKILPAEDRLSTLNLALDSDATSVAVAFFAQPPRVLLAGIPSGVQRVLSFDALTNIMALALSPDGDLLAMRDNSHVEVWRLRPTPAGAPVLDAVLPLPFDVPAGSELAFSPDASRLVLASTGALVWQVDDWTQSGRVPFQTFPNAAGSSRQLELTPDASHIATPSGLWRIAPGDLHASGHEK